ncbi:hypothetical protein TNCV_2953321 [Trichonephila clavipes]|nr:hypothetical protein TNCV_2953321 [Trichonephila clavipes]
MYDFQEPAEAVAKVASSWPALLLLSSDATKCKCRENGIIEHRWCDGQVCPDVGQELWPSGSRRPESVFACYVRIGPVRLLWPANEKGRGPTPGV